MKPERTIIVGAGIGGMAFAAALERLGLPYVLLERAPELGEVGSGLGVLPGAVRALETLGVSPDLFREAAPFERFFVCSSAGSELAELSFTRVFERAGRTGYVMHRGALHAALSALVNPDAVRTGAEVTSIEERDDGVEVRLRDGLLVRGDLLVGADGLHSVVRRHVVGDGAPRYAGETIFRGIAEATLERPEICRELFGDGRRTAHYQLGEGQLGEGRVYWWATAPAAAGSVMDPAERRAYLERAFADWAFGVPELFAKTPDASILQNDIFDRKPVRRWHRGRAVLLGDAAHPTTPNLGQGACMAIEDAVVLARSIRRASEPEDAFQAFHRSRARRTARTVFLSRLWGQVGLWRRPALVALRDAAFRSTPSSWLERAALDQYAYDPGPLD